jgi:hypothetical protein
MPKFNKGDRVKPSKLFGIGNDYSIGLRFANATRDKHKFFTVTHFKENIGSGFVWFKEVDCYWPPEWFEKASIQLEFDFEK